MKETLTRIYKKTIKKKFPPASDIVETFLVKELGDASRILDLGCGAYSPIGRVKDRLRSDAYLVAVDDFAPYIELNKSRKPPIHSEYIKSNIFNISFPDKSFDAVILLDVIEHFDRKDFLEFLPRLEKMVKKIIIMTPNGFINQDEYDDNTYQVHKSGWTANDLRRLGFACFGVSGVKFLRGERGVSKIRPTSIGNIISNISEPLVYNRPERAFHLLCVKNTP